MAKRRALLPILVAGGGLAVGLALVVWWPAERSTSPMPGPDVPQQQQDAPVADEPSSPALPGAAVPPTSLEEPTDLAPEVEAAPSTADEERPLAELERYGPAPGVSVDSHPSVALVADPQTPAQAPERRSALMPPKPFDPDAYRADPASYLVEPVPGRVFQSHPPGPEVPRIRLVTPQLQRLDQGASCELAVRVAPGAPVTFTTFDLGAFANGLTTISVAADDRTGIATVPFTATAGSMGLINILAASPMASGQAAMQVDVSVPVALKASDPDASEEAQP